jgi:hypothetical protein
MIDALPPSRAARLPSHFLSPASVSTDSGVGFLLEPIEWEESEFVHNASGPASSAPPSPFAEPKTLTHFLFRQPKQSYDEEPPSGPKKNVQVREQL